MGQQCSSRSKWQDDNLDVWADRFGCATCAPPTRSSVNHVIEYKKNGQFADQLNDIFQKYKSGTASIPGTEVDQFLSELWVGMTKWRAKHGAGTLSQDEQIARWKHEFDYDCNGSLSFSEFREALLGVVGETSSSAKTSTLEPASHQKFPEWFVSLFESFLMQNLERRLANTSSITMKDVPRPKACRFLKKRNFWGVELAIEDEDLTSGILFSQQSLSVTYLFAHFGPRPDYKGMWKSEAQAVDMLDRAFGRLLPPPKLDWQIDMTSDEATARFAFVGLGSEMIRAANDTDRAALSQLYQDARAGEAPVAAFVLCCNFMRKYKVTSTYLTRYGADAYFTEDQSLFCLTRDDRLYLPSAADEDDGKNSQKSEWEFVKYCFRCSVLVYVSVVHHASWCHALFSNSCAIASQETLPADHPIRLLVHPFTFGAATFNHNMITSLISKGGLIDRLGVHYDSLVEMFSEGLALAHTRSPKAEAAFRGLPADSPYVQDGMACYQAHESFVSDYLSLYFDLAAAILDPFVLAYYSSFRSRLPAQLQLDTVFPDVKSAKWKHIQQYLTLVLFYVTTYHEHVSQVVEYSKNPYVAAYGLREGMCSASPQMTSSTMIMMSTSAVMSVRMPLLLEDWGSRLEKNAYKAWQDYQGRLRAVQKEIELNNLTRKWPFTNFSPKLAHISVSV
eukprot:gb/GEZN01003000.1/.p1 GENE.gb/GEZN01003000.1/~~gb/GEZN01003000.1/.p1  ORF type:complete len:676 (+),score=80.38 gb/GEZN01003000.1/:58-2085(+)